MFCKKTAEACHPLENGYKGKLRGNGNTLFKLHPLSSLAEGELLGVRFL